MKLVFFLYFTKIGLIHSNLKENLMATTSKTSQSKIISWEEFIKHNSENDCWMCVRGKVYEVTSWIPKHPGGSDPIVFNGVLLLFF